MGGAVFKESLEKAIKAIQYFNKNYKESFIKSKAIQFLVMLLLLVIPFISMVQTGLEEPPPGGEGVTFEEKMNLIFIIVGIAFAVMITIKQLHKKTAASK
jgi:hypothetical protein